MSLFKLNLNAQTLIIIITAIFWAMNFRFSFHNINYHMDAGNFYSLKFDPFLILIKNIVCIFYFIPYFLTSKIHILNIISNDNKRKHFNTFNLQEIKEVNKTKESLGEMETIVKSNNLNNRCDKCIFLLKLILIIIFIYFVEELYFIMANNHILDRTLCPVRNIFVLFSILIFSSILFNKILDKTQIKNFFAYKNHQLIPLIIIFTLSIFLLLYNYLKIERFKYIYNINLLYYMICFLLVGCELSLIKYLVDNLYINKFFVLGLKGILGTIAFIIIYTKISKDDFYNFFDELLSYQYTIESEEFNVLFKIFYVLTTCINQYLKIVVINKFSEMHFLSTLMIADILLFPLYCIERFIIQKFMISTVDTFFINVSISVINSILMLIFNEILELNFCGLNKHLRKNIIKRENQEIYGYSDIDADDENENSSFEIENH